MHGSNGHGAQKANDMSYHLGELAAVCQSPTQQPRARRRQALNIDAAAGRRDVYVAAVECQTLFISMWGGVGDRKTFMSYDIIIM